MKLVSVLDASVNFTKDQSVGKIEARYVRRKDWYFSCYLSTQTGCNQGCKFCHLTAMGETKFTNVSSMDILEQAKRVLNHYESLSKPAEVVNYNFMARGEPLASEAMLECGEQTLHNLGLLAETYELLPKFNISTIMPKKLFSKWVNDKEVHRKVLARMFRTITPTFYYSLYSVNDNFRKYWLPAAIDPNKALGMLSYYQEFTTKRQKIHWAFIKGQNDSFKDVMDTLDAVLDHKLTVDVNIVRYNPADNSEESSEGLIFDRAELIRSRLKGSHVQVVPRVGFDVRASCGMFLR